MTNIILMHFDLSTYCECPFPMMLTFYLQAFTITYIFFARVRDKPSKNHRVFYAFSKYSYYSFWMQLIYFSIFEIFKYSYSPSFYYGTLGEEVGQSILFLRFSGSLLLVFYIYTISLMNVRICKSELD